MLSAMFGVLLPVHVLSKSVRLAAFSVAVMLNESDLDSSHKRLRPQDYFCQSTDCGAIAYFCCGSSCCDASWGRDVTCCSDGCYPYLDDVCCGTYACHTGYTCCTTGTGCCLDTTKSSNSGSTSGLSGGAVAAIAVCSGIAGLVLAYYCRKLGRHAHAHVHAQTTPATYTVSETHHESKPREFHK